MALEELYLVGIDFIGKRIAPDIWVSDIYSINLGYLKDIGIKALFLTLITH